MEGDGAHLAVFNRMTRDGLTEMACEQRREADEEVSCEKPWAKALRQAFCVGWRTSQEAPGPGQTV